MHGTGPTHTRQHWRAAPSNPPPARLVQVWLPGCPKARAHARTHDSTRTQHTYTHTRAPCLHVFTRTQHTYTHTHNTHTHAHAHTHTHAHPTHTPLHARCRHRVGHTPRAAAAAAGQHCRQRLLGSRPKSRSQAAAGLQLILHPC